jgi:hypothetical protein
MSFTDSSGNATQAYTSGVVPLKSLSAVSSTGGGTALDGLAVRAVAVMVVSSSAGVSAGSVQLQGSLDGTNWYSLGSAVSTSSASTVFTPVVVSSAYSRYVRANVATGITGGTITALVGLSG